MTKATNITIVNIVDKSNYVGGIMNDDTVLKIREFNRFYLSVMNLYGNHYAGGHYSITETRVLYEIHRHEGCSAEYIARKLHIDKG